MAIKCYHCKGNHELVSQVKDCAKVPAAFAAKVEIGKIVETVIPATVVTTSIPAHRTSAAYLALKAKQTPAAVEMVKIPGLDVSVPAPAAFIDSLSEIQAAAKPVVKTGQDLELGMYQVTSASGEVVIYKIKWNKTNTYKYAERLWITTSAKYDTATGQWIDMPKGKFVYANSMMKTLTSENKMTHEMAKAFHDATKAKYGVDYGFCCFCGKLLTVKKSIEQGYGPVCASKI